MEGRELCVQDPRLTQHTCMPLNCGPYSVWVSCHRGKRGEEVKKLVLPWYGAKARQSVVSLLFGIIATLLLEKAMATHSSILAWRIPGMGEPGGLLSMGSHRVGHG